ncbi:MAG: aminoacyl-tRNA hydrolase [Acidobacteriota bacterium]|nr:aminoacyl-tRNA hydrolase [Acidobacteriota bacterium]MDH3529645.1 aminoacyl-tRNA hydrolase [Acidobacteriota bacterium]
MNSAAETVGNWLVVGLGNPGPEYERTRHNVGFMVIDKLAERWNIPVKRTECRSLIGQKRSAGGRVELAKPQTYMNLSGEAVSCLLTNETRAIGSMLIVVDDLALPFGTLRMRRKGSDGGHNGLKSISSCLRTEDFPRMRIGIAPDHPVSNARKFVLENFPRAAEKELREIISLAAEAAECAIEDGIDRAMSRFNK